MPNVVLDANVLISAALLRSSVPARAVDAAVKHATVCLSSAVFDEVNRAVARPKLARAASAATATLDALAKLAIWLEPSIPVTDCRDPDDNKYLELALAAGAEIIVSGDADLLALHPWRGVRILRPAEYVREVEARTR